MKSRQSFNPFIVLSDVTISVIVILVVLLMLVASLLSAQVGRTRAELTNTTRQLVKYRQKYDPREEVLREISHTQDEILRATDSSKWGSTTTPVLRSKGPQRLLLRFPNSAKQFSGDALTAVGRAQFGKLAELLAPMLLHYQDYPEDRATLLEVQIQGHASSFDLSLRRAKLVRDLLARHPGFPAHLLSIAAYGSYRPAYESSESLGKTRLLRGNSGQVKALYTQRIDVILVFAGQASENDYVRSVEPNGTAHGPLNDVSDPKIHQKEFDEGYKR